MSVDRQGGEAAEVLPVPAVMSALAVCEVPTNTAMEVLRLARHAVRSSGSAAQSHEGRAPRGIEAENVRLHGRLIEQGERIERLEGALAARSPQDEDHVPKMPPDKSSTPETIRKHRPQDEDHEAIKVCAYCSQTVPQSAHGTSCEGPSPECDTRAENKDHEADCRHPRILELGPAGRFCAKCGDPIEVVSLLPPPERDTRAETVAEIVDWCREQYWWPATPPGVAAAIDREFGPADG